MVANPIGTSRSPSSPYQSLNEGEVDSRVAYLPPSAATSPASSSLAEYTLTLDDHQGKTWWMLRISSRSPDSKSLPTFVEGDPITGIVDVSLQKPDHVKAIIVSVKGLVIYSAHESKTFVEVSQTIWQSNSASHTGELQPGDYCLPFLLRLPSTIQLPEEEAVDYGLAFNGSLPPTLEDIEGHADIRYRIALRVKRSGLFHHDSKLSTWFNYVPATRPDPLSPLRASSYSDGLPIVGPEIDPDGWKVFPAVHFDGRLFKAVEACLAISLALAIPLAYPRGTAIPCAIVLTSSNKQAVHLLSSPKALVVEVRRQLQTAVGESMVGGTVDFAEEDRSPLTKANWHQPDIHEVDGVFTATVLGELSLPPDLVPSFSLGKFKCEYVVDVYPPVALGFESATEERLFRTSISVTSLLRPGPRPRAFLPPGYLASDSPISGKGPHRFLRADSFA